ncbi:single-stranded-DNA-specific exonuclease RecJ [Loigolactobacillus jiayinensis]|uniref:Single-stranded-DNA-specific exonuclease RecJ n=1 Tax=Loigolactobacillus jiayinensis TaxID=2486016 RepID=A0ABW1RD95_9LACO|nr:single-stranded-DNA-specific exonuclease RecJ [Loigolactobacillus jiayinensis]
MKSRYNWQYLPQPRATLVTELAEKCQLAPAVVRLLINRGLTDPTKIEEFLNPGVDQLHDPLLLFGMQKAVDRIRQAIEENQLITVYGDYDADGVTSTSLMMETLEGLGANVNIYIPNRFDEGYGPHEAAFEKLLAAQTQLIITVDNGISGNGPIAYAQEHGVDVIVTDHHELPPELPPAFAIIHPRHPDGQYPFGDLAGVGVAFKLASALMEETASDSFDLAAIGTISDLVSLTGENRALVSLGLQQLQQSTRPGITALCEVAGLEQAKIDEQAIGFGIGPRLNALGRLGDAKDGVKLLTTFDPDEATQLAKFVQTQNERRQQYVKDIAATAMEMAQTPENRQRQTLVLAHPDWHEGVLGIVASRIVEATGKPTLMLTQRADHSLKGSGRSVQAFNLFKALDQYRDLMTSFGGHHMAVGLAVSAANLAPLAAGLEAQADAVDLRHQGSDDLQVDLKLTVPEVTSDFLQACQQLAPFGTDNPAPKIAITPEKVTGVRAIGTEQAHLKFKLTSGTSALDVIAFQKGQYADDLMAADTVTVVGELGENEWQGRRTLQLQLTDFATSGLEIIDKRTTHLTRHLFQYTATYVFFSAKLQQQLATYLPADATAVLATDEFTALGATLVLVDVPPTLAALQALLKQHQTEFDKLICFFYMQHPVYLAGLPTRAEFGRLFKFTATKQTVNVRTQLPVLAKHLQLKKDLLIFMIQVFSDLGFVKIVDGVMTGVAQPAKADLQSAASYQQRQQQMDAEQALVYSNYQELKTWLNAQIVPDEGAKSNVS